MSTIPPLPDVPATRKTPPAAPPLPMAPTKRVVEEKLGLGKFKVESNGNRAASGVLLGELFELMDRLSDEQVAEVHIYLAEHPMAGLDPVRQAMAGVNALKESELFTFLEQLRATVPDEVWEIL